ncbi:MAG: hypothetical protein GFH27_549319n134 [Chloroflexi bacterium AL-W]|nr:hypothetical protein [Chloroflexi bacterium AL-N1]NOK71297.1 hypothetical protein [Chloroflexi bacterium AL-N10]NOK77672.1 hypothetical protein [Chloroflexi bacterium AL-N5]NOK84523.1 hypothetical protein [Chloroflexi bacterium AL-W]NOK92974.1 hypothetical protein [Chloroflexi bacterium AL-N15]
MDISDNRLSEALKVSGWGLDTLAKTTGISKGTLQHWRKARSKPQHWTDALPIIKLLNWSKHELELWLLEVYDMDLSTAQQRTPPDRQHMLDLLDQLCDLSDKESSNSLLKTSEGDTDHKTNMTTMLISFKDKLRLLARPKLTILWNISLLTILCFMGFLLFQRNQQPISEPGNQQPTSELGVRVSDPGGVEALQLMHTDRPANSLDQINFYWTSSYANGTIYIEVCTQEPAYWISSREVHPNAKIWGMFSYESDKECNDALAAAMGVLIGDVMSFGIGAGAHMPERTGVDVPLTHPSGTRMYTVTRTGTPNQELKVTFEEEIQTQ